MSKGLQAVEEMLDLASAMENLDGDAELLREVVEIFLEMAPEMLDALEGSIAGGDVAAVDAGAHSLKGSASNFCATRFVETAFRLEKLAKGGSLAGAQELMQQLRRELQALVDVRGAIDWQEVVARWEN